jgi:hypothetical protein
MLQQGLGLGPEYEDIVHLAVEQWLHAETIAGEEYLITQAIPDGKSEDAI